MAERLPATARAAKCAGAAGQQAQQVSSPCARLRSHTVLAATNKVPATVARARFARPATCPRPGLALHARRGPSTPRAPQTQCTRPGSAPAAAARRCWRGPRRRCCRRACSTCSGASSPWSATSRCGLGGQAGLHRHWGGARWSAGAQCLPGGNERCACLASTHLPQPPPAARAAAVAGRAIRGPAGVLPVRPLPHAGQLPVVGASGRRAAEQAWHARRCRGVGGCWRTWAAGGLMAVPAPLPSPTARYRFYLLFVFFYVTMVSGPAVWPRLRGHRCAPGAAPRSQAWPPRPPPPALVCNIENKITLVVPNIVQLIYAHPRLPGRLPRSTRCLPPGTTPSRAACSRPPTTGTRSGSPSSPPPPSVSASTKAG